MSTNSNYPSNYHSQLSNVYDPTTKSFVSIEPVESKELQKQITRKDILDGAVGCVCGDRDNQYGPPEQSFAEIAKLWGAYLDVDISPRDAAIMMGLFKVARMKTGHWKVDNFIDCCGYFACAGELEGTNPHTTK